MTASFSEMKKLYNGWADERLKGLSPDDPAGDIRVPPEDEIAAFQCSPVGHAIAAFYHNMATMADVKMHGIKTMEDGGAETYFALQGTIDAACAFFGELQRWEDHHRERRQANRGGTDEHRSDL